LDEVCQALSKYGSNADSEFLADMFKEIRIALASWPSWTRVFHDDGPATFFRTSVSVGALGNARGKYFLSLTGQHSGEKPEVGLAVLLNKPRVVGSNVINVEVGPIENHRVTLDFEPIMRGLSQVMPITMNGVQFVNQIAEKSTDPYDGTDTIVVFRNAHHTIAVAPHNIHSRYVFKLNNITDTWSFNGSTLTAPVANAFALGKTEYPPMISVRVLPTQFDSEELTGPVVWYKLEDKATAMSLAEAIADALGA
jgi:hypothetical protein